MLVESETHALSQPAAPVRLDTVEAALAEIAAGRPVVVVDDEDREDEGDLIMAADAVTPEWMAFIIRHTSGLVCLPMTGAALDRLGIPAMVHQNDDRMQTAFAVSVDARSGVTTGISARDRARTARLLADPRTGSADLTRPGHLLPLRAREGGVLVRAGHTEAAVDLARIAGLAPAGVICEITKKDGTMARVPDLMAFARKHKLPIITIADLIRSRMRTERMVTRVAMARMPTAHGEFAVHAYESRLDGETHIALVKGDLGTGERVLLRVHSKCLTGDVFHSARCDCGEQLHSAMEQIAREGRGVLLYLNQEGRGIGLANKIRAYELQDQGFDTVEANEKLGFKPDQRDYGIGAQVLRDLGVRSMRLLTNNPRKFVGLEGYGLSVVESVPIEIAPSEHTLGYLRTKKSTLGHKLSVV